MSTLVRLIAVLTLVSGIVQAVAPGWVLSLVHADVTPTTTQTFAIVGFFMALFGGLLWQSTAGDFAIGVFWSALQKVGASAAVFIGIHRAVFSGPMAAGVASFDGLSAILIFIYYAQLRRAPAP